MTHLEYKSMFLSMGGGLGGGSSPMYSVHTEYILP
jgi:hypothetical protein